MEKEKGWPAAGGDVMAQARAEFKARFTYADLTRFDVEMLAMFINRECAIRAIAGGLPRLWVPGLGEKGVRVCPSKDGGIESAFVTVSGDCFESREAVSFNGDGFIGFCGWASDASAAPVVGAFRGWLRWMQAAKGAAR
ncbi:hypothetical protein GMI70_02990 [Eggerthellaceae bacterium zg-893]|nr:hypothetical protein [Eggerthellaceae bacterium zg-893]